MSIIKQKPFSMINEGMENVLDKIVILHKNVDASNTARILAYGSAQSKKYGLIYETYGGTPNSIDVDTWVLVHKVDSSSSGFPDGVTKGEVFYNDTGSVITLAGTDSAVGIRGVELNKGGVAPTGSVIQARYIPCETVMVEIHDAENLLNNYRTDLVTRTPVEVPEAA